MLDYLRTGKTPTNPRDLLEQITKQFPADPEKCRRIFVAAVLDHPGFVQAAIEAAFDTWSPRPPQ
jgi:hypothetical protein